MSGAWLGVIADDVTGACDLAGGVADLGFRVELRLGVPDGDVPPESADCIVVALKTRTAPVRDAVSQSRESALALRQWGAARLYQKYCSTFDSTDEGNIGPVADALADVLGEGTASFGTPASPALGRTQHEGHLFVGDRLLSESSLATHPLTPMHDPDLVRVLGRQTRRPVGLVATADVRDGAAAIAGRVARLRDAGIRHLLVDATVDADLDAAAEALLGPLADVPLLLGGGAGLATALARRHEPPAGAPPPLPEVEDGRCLILSGSGSERTREQVAAHDGPTLVLDPLELERDADAVVARAVAQLRDDEATLLVSATAEPDVVRRIQSTLGTERSAALIESALGRIAVAAVADADVRRIIVAGGETSGAVADALGVRRLAVGRLAAPGVPWTISAPDERPAVALLLKSGNFGAADLFATAWEVAP